MIYFKNAGNKWWCGYEEQAKVLMDELPLETSTWLINYLKRWTDKLPCILEYKGGWVWARYLELIVTSQHSMEDFFALPHDSNLKSLEMR